MFTVKDAQGVPRGSCSSKDCNCDGFLRLLYDRTERLGPGRLGSCSYCGHGAIEHMDFGNQGQLQPASYEFEGCPTVSTVPASLKEESEVRDITTTQASWCGGFELPVLSPALSPLLEGKNVSEAEQAYLSRQLRQELLKYLNENNLIMDKFDGLRAWKYDQLGRWLSLRYPKIIWDRTTPGTRKRGRMSGPWEVLIYRLWNSRRRQKNKADKAAQKFQRQKGNEGDAEVSDQLLTVVQNADNRSVFWCENCPLPTFPAALSPLLHGGNISEKQTRQLSRHLRRYLVDYLDGNKLIEEGSDIVKRLKYNELGKWLSVTYPNMRWETVERERLKKPKVVHRWTLFIFRLRELRRRKELYGCATVPLYTDPKPTG